MRRGRQAAHSPLEKIPHHKPRCAGAASETLIVGLDNIYRDAIDFLQIRRRPTMASVFLVLLLSSQIIAGSPEDKMYQQIASEPDPAAKLVKVADFEKQ